MENRETMWWGEPLKIPRDFAFDLWISNYVNKKICVFPGQSLGINLVGHFHQLPSNMWPIAMPMTTNSCVVIVRPLQIKKSINKTEKSFRLKGCSTNAKVKIVGNILISEHVDIFTVDILMTAEKFLKTSWPHWLRLK